MKNNCLVVSGQAKRFNNARLVRSHELKGLPSMQLLELPESASVKNKP